MGSDDIIYKGIAAEQLPGVFEAWAEFLPKNNPDRVLELGTGYGGLTLLFAEWCWSRGVYMMTIDKNDRVRCKSQLTDLAVTIVTNSFEASHQRIKNFLAIGKKPLILCDGGCGGTDGKEHQIHQMAPLLKPGWLFCAHDYPYPENGGFSEAIGDSFILRYGLRKVDTKLWDLGWWVAEKE